MNFADDDNQFNNQLLEFADDDVCKKPWKFLIVDDNEDIHTVTKLVLSDYVFENRPLKIFSSYSRAEAFEAMSTENTGLNCVRDTREHCSKNSS